VIMITNRHLLFAVVLLGVLTTILLAVAFVSSRGQGSRLEAAERRLALLDPVVATLDELRRATVLTNARVVDLEADCLDALARLEAIPPLQAALAAIEERYTADQTTARRRDEESATLIQTFEVLLSDLRALRAQVQRLEGVVGLLTGIPTARPGAPAADTGRNEKER
jgi:hypothetical protein